MLQLRKIEAFKVIIAAQGDRKIEDLQRHANSKSVLLYVGTFFTLICDCDSRLNIFCNRRDSREEYLYIVSDEYIC